MPNPNLFPEKYTPYKPPQQGPLSVRAENSSQKRQGTYRSKSREEYNRGICRVIKSQNTQTRNKI